MVKSFLVLFLIALETALQAASPQKIEIQIRKELASRKGNRFESDLVRWQKQHGTQAVPALLAIAKDSKTPDSSRFIALMGAAKLGGKATAPQLIPLLKDRSWMIRNASLRALKALKSPEGALAALPLLEDPALVVRSEAIATIRALQPPGAKEALARSLVLPTNYRGGKALWVARDAAHSLIALSSGTPMPIDGLASTRAAPLRADPPPTAAEKALLKALELAPKDRAFQAQVRDGLTAMKRGSPRRSAR